MTAHIPNRLAELMRLQDEYAGTEAAAVLRDLENHARTFGVFVRNHSTLAPVLARFKNDSAFALDLMRTGGDMHGFLQSLDQPLHNYLASAKTLLDHQRVLRQKRLPAGSTELTDYEERVRRDFKENCLSQFVQRLRNYLLHYSLPGTGGTIRFNQDSVAHAVHLSAVELLQWSDWTAPARAFIEAAPHGEVDLHDVITQYSNRVVQFHQWFGRALVRANWPHIQAVHPLASQINALIEEVRPHIEATFGGPPTTQDTHSAA